MKISNESFHKIAALDLDPIKKKLRHQSGQGWSQARAEAIETEYRRFLFLQHTYQGEGASPTADVDTFWHYHILDTAKYAADCEQAFGYFMHHYPYVGLLGEDDEGAEERSGNRTRELYEATFGEAYIRAESYGADGNGIDSVQVDDPVHQTSYMHAKKVTAARCTYCVVGKPRAKAAEGARCTYCVTAKPKGQATQGARCTYCTATKPATLLKPPRHRAAPQDI